MYSPNDQSPRLVVDAARNGAASLTYEPFYGLREKPFSLSADPRFLFRSPAHGPAFDELQAGIRRREGLIVLTGEIGTGKTTLCRSVLQHLDRRTFASFVADPFVSREDLLKTLLVDFGVIAMGDLTRGRFSGASRSDLSYPLYEFLDSLVPLQAFAVVVIDEAQNLSLPLLEEIRILSELERREKLLQVVLVGQPELRSSLRLPEMRQVDQRVSVRCELTTLDRGGVAGYVTHRLGVAGRGESRVAFTPSALDALYETSAGVPRLINRICDRTLQRAFVARSLQVDADFVLAAVADLGLTAAEKPEVRVEAPRATAAAPRDTMSIPEPAVEPIPSPAIPELAVVEEAGLAEFAAEESLNAAAADDSRPRRRWWVVAAVAFLMIIGSIGAPAWYSRGTTVDSRDVTDLLPPSPAHTIALPAVRIPHADGAIPSSPQPGTSPLAAATVAAPRTTTPKAAASGYSIVVASFQNHDRADRLVDELVNAGYGARAVERAGGPTGRLLQVMISGYTSAIDVQRDLQRIRELPGGYADARIIEEN